MLILMFVQVRFALCSSSTFSRTDLVTDSETFYKSVLGLLEDREEKTEVDALLTWWNRYAPIITSCGVHTDLYPAEKFSRFPWSRRGCPFEARRYHASRRNGANRTRVVVVKFFDSVFDSDLQ